MAGGRARGARSRGPAAHTLLHPRLSHAAARAFFVGAEGKLPSTAGEAVARIGAQNSLVRRYTEMRGGLPGSERRGVVAETGRLRATECITLLAQWHVEEPDSPELLALEQKIRDHPDFSRKISLQRVPSLMPLLGAEASPEGGDPVLNAMRATDRFVQYFHHAAPFPRSALREQFRECEVPEHAAKCAEATERVEDKLGPLPGEG